MLKLARQLLNKSPATSPILQEIPQPPPFEPEAASEPDFVVGEQTSIMGKIAFQGLAVIHGLFEGEFEGGRSLIVGEQGFVKADLHLDEADISGKVEGNITVRHRLILRGSAEIRGNITAPRLTVEDGVSIMGQVAVTPVGTPDLNTPF